MTGDRPAPRILLVDDAVESRAILAIALRTIPGAGVDIADSAESALEFLAGVAVDVVITDVRMRGMDGLEFLAALREQGRWPRAGAFVISGETDPDLPERALAAGATAFFAKPFSAVEVRKAVLSLLQS